jgi:hypothetical protein
MKISKKHITRSNHSGLVFVLMFLTITLCAGQSCAHTASEQPISPQVGVKLLSAEVTRFDKPIRIGVGKRAIEYQEALVLKVLVDREKFDSLPPSMEPFLYIGRYEYRTFHIDRNDRRKELILTFHVRNREELEDGAPVVLTIDHGGPIRDPERFIRRDTPRFAKGMIVDKR